MKYLQLIQISAKGISIAQNHGLLTEKNFLALMDPGRALEFHNIGFQSHGPVMLTYKQQKKIMGIYTKRVFVDSKLDETISTDLHKQRQDNEKKAMQKRINRSK
ncbi:MAG: hypothetical protein GY816_10995 [Cytophagales bacterium]|nr:hypothetical protein [Cytophagales bacterium]